MCATTEPHYYNLKAASRTQVTRIFTDTENVHTRTFPFFLQKINWIHIGNPLQAKKKKKKKKTLRVKAAPREHKKFRTE